MAGLGHGEKNSRRAYLVSIASISGIPKCSRAGPSRARSVRASRVVSVQRAHQQLGFHPAALRQAARQALFLGSTNGNVSQGCWPSIS